MKFILANYFMHRKIHEIKRAESGIHVISQIRAVLHMNASKGDVLVIFSIMIIVSFMLGTWVHD